MRTPIRHPALTSKSAKLLLENSSSEVLKSAAIGTIDQLVAIADGLEAVRNVGDPMQTPEARAVKYRESHGKATDRADQLIRTAVDKIVDYEGKVLRDAYERAGIARPPAEAAEIRTALRTMTQKDRDKAIQQAMVNKDAAVIASIQNVSPVLTGRFTTPVVKLTELYLDKYAPDLKAEQANIESALESLNIAASAFRQTAERLRDLDAEKRADEGQQAAKMAEAKLGLAIQSQPT